MDITRYFKHKEKQDSCSGSSKDLNCKKTRLEVEEPKEPTNNTQDDFTSIGKYLLDTFYQLSSVALSGVSRF